MAGTELVVMLAMVAFNSVFAAYELSLAAVSVGRLQILHRESRPGAAAALYMKENVEASLATIQLAITLFGAVAAATGGAGADQLIAPVYQARLGVSAGWAELLAVVTVVLPLTGVTIVFGELIPKVFALRNKEWVCLTLSPWMRWFSVSVWPVVWLLETVVSGVTDWGEKRFRAATADAKAESAEVQELRAAAALARTSRLIGAREEGIILGAVRLSTRTVREIMVPAAGISLLAADASLTDALIAAHLDMHTRFPVTDRPGDPQGVIGYVNLKDVVAVMRLSPDRPTLRGVLRPIQRFREADTIASCLERLLLGSGHIALVVDAADHVVGLVTLEDIVEELLGDIKDEYDRLPTHLIAVGNGCAVGGGVGLPQLRDACGFDLTGHLPPAGAGTLAEWVAGHLGRPAKAGDAVERGGARVSVRKVRRQQLLEAHVTPARPKP